MKHLSLIITALLLAGTTHAATIAIIDSGTDLKHKDLVNKKWVNPIDIDDAVDNDDNGYIDDINGWNFADNNNKLIDMKYLGTFQPDVYKFFEVQTRMLKGEGTDADKAWMEAARKNDKLLTDLETFANFVHGTHVAGLSAKDSDQAKLMIVKLIATKRSANLIASAKETAFAQIAASHGNEGLIKAALKLLASQQSKALTPIGQYVGKEKARLANCSFGMSTAASKMILKPILKAALKHDPTDAELQDYAVFFVGEVVKAYKSFFDAAPKTLFVIAAGNDGDNNDVSPAAPANVKRDNTFTVAATFGYKKIASFSNYGEKMVDVAAPGVGILSSIPGDQYLTVSGTSQAAPFVTNVAELALDQNPNLSNSDLKMLISKTVDHKDFLQGKVVAAGIVNAQRAATAAKLALHMQLSEAIESAKVQVNDVDTGAFGKSLESDYEGFVMPLPNLF